MFKGIVILDAGSSGTRFYAYQWIKDGLPPKVTLAYEGPKGMCIMLGYDDPSLSAFSAKKPLQSNTTEEDLKAYLNKIFEPAVTPSGNTGKKNLYESFGENDKSPLKDVPIFVLGTAGMRVYERDHPTEHARLKGWVEKYIKDRDEYEAGTYETITGESEAAYGWVAANFLLGAFSSEYETTARDTVGYLEMGGQSAQIAFRPFENELTPDMLHDGDITTIQLGTRNFDLVLKTWDLGSNQAWREYQSDLIGSATENQVQCSQNVQTMNSC